MKSLAINTLASLLLLNLGTAAISQGARTTRRAGSASRRPANVSAPTSGHRDMKSVITPADDAAQETFLKFKAALVRITVSLDGVPISTGNGFFTANDGTLLTSFEVVRPAILFPKTKIEFQLSDGTTQNTFTIAGCSDQRNIDLCKLKIPAMPRKFLALNAVNSSPGSKNILVANTGTEFVAFAVTTSSIESSLSNIEEIIMSLQVHAEGLGAPVIENNGDVIGMSANFGPFGTGEFGAIAVSELARFNASHIQFISIANFVRKYRFDLANSAKAFYTTAMAPALKTAAAGSPLHANKNFKETTLDLGNEKLKLYLPTSFESCRISSRTGLLFGSNEIVLSTCPSKDGSSLMTIERLPAIKAGIIGTLNNKRLVDPKPLVAIEELEANLRWREYENKLPKSQRADFFSNPSLANCRRLPTIPLAKSHFSGALGCRFTVRADATLGGYTSSYWIESGKYIYGINVWMDDVSRAQSLGSLASLIAMSTVSATSLRKAQPVPSAAHAAGKVAPHQEAASSKNSSGHTNSAEARTVASLPHAQPSSYYQMNLPSGVSFLESKHRNDNTQYDTYGYANSVGETMSNYVLVVDRMNAVFRPSDYDRSINELMKSMTRSLRVQASIAQDKFDITTLDGLPARLVSTMGKRDGKDVLILMVVGFGSSDTHLITQISDSNNPGKSFTDFRLMSSSFKRK